MEDLDSMVVLYNLVSRQTIFKMLRIEFNRKPKDEKGIKLCDEQLEILEKKIDDVIVNGTGDKNKQPVGILKLKREI